MKLDRRSLIASLAATGAASATSAALPFRPPLGARARVLLVNDLAGDVDGLFAAAHMALSPSVALRAIVATGTGVPSESAERAATLAREMLDAIGEGARPPVLTGAPGRLRPGAGPDRSPGVAAIIAEARRTDSALPLYVAVGGGLTEVASALQIAPEISSRFTLIWIGGAAHPTGGREYNFAIDPLAAQYVFNVAAVPIWQVPSDAYATCQVSFAEIEARMAGRSRIGDWLHSQLIAAAQRMASMTLNTGETWTLGDNPLVLLTALTAWPPSALAAGARRYETTGSSRYQDMPTPSLDDAGRYAPRADARSMRAYTAIDVRLMLEDMFAKLALSGGR